MQNDPRYPIGKAVMEPFSETQKTIWIQALRDCPEALEAAVANLDKAQLATPYREGGWQVQQLVHHIADSHMNAFIRFKLGLTEEIPALKAYDENKWVTTADTMESPITLSISLLYALHERWAKLLESLTAEQWQRKVFHPGRNVELSLWELFTIYAWHGKHHIAHITHLRAIKKW